MQANTDALDVFAELEKVSSRRTTEYLQDVPGS